MAQGDVTVQIIDADATAIDTAVTAMRVTANDKWLMSSVGSGLQVCVIHIEEA
jgi:hypothetical protein|tara:strand:- start:78 stop:236 length:159 start_codon:yes stop_codon:yes gene_type:complete